MGRGKVKGRQLHYFDYLVKVFCWFQNKIFAFDKIMMDGIFDCDCSFLYYFVETQW